MLQIYQRIAQCFTQYLFTSLFLTYKGAIKLNNSVKEKHILHFLYSVLYTTILNQWNDVTHLQTLPKFA